MNRVTFTLNQATVDQLRRSAAYLGKSHSEIVRLAIREYAERIGHLGEQERSELLKLFDQLVPRIPPRPAAGVKREIRAIRAARDREGRAARSRR